MNEPKIPTNIDRLRIEITKLEATCTAEQFVANLNLPSWDVQASSSGFSAYTWWLEDGYGLHACFADGPGICTNRFGPCGISHEGAFVWKLSQQENHWNSMRGMTIEELAAATHPYSKSD
ncbi:hypothetical protein OAG71_04175 [bacterium]|nr:hypothetical protein [bacterium]